MSLGVATAYPWNALEHITRESARRAARARRHVQGILDLARVGGALSELSDSEASIIVRRVSSDAPRRRPSAEMGFELGNSGAVCALCVEPALVANLLCRILRRPVTLTVEGALDDALTGAFSAVLLEAARRSGAQGALHLIDPTDAIARARDVFVEATALIAGTPYPVLAAVGLPLLANDPVAPLSALGELAIAVPLVIGTSLAERVALAEFTPGNAWFPGAGLWLDAHAEGPIALVAPMRDDGVSGALSRDGKIVLRGESVQLLSDPGELMSDPEKSDPSRLSDAVLDSPVVVRVEMGAVSMTAREWAELGPGDVIETGRRIAEPVILRVAGREVARGELVNLEGELGVRIRELVRS